METALFWVAWGLISFWALKTFYYSFSKDKLEHLRKANIGFTIAVLILYFLPWVPLSMDGWTGFGLALNGNFLAILFFIFLFNSLILFLQKEYIFLKIAAVLTILSTLSLFALMISLRPESFTLSLYDIAPIVAVFILLCQIVAVLLLWQQMQLQKKDVLVATKKKKIIIGAVSLAIFIVGILIFVAGSKSQVSESLDEQVVKTSEKKDMKRFEAFGRNDGGIICSGKDHFSFQVESPYSILSDDDRGIAIIAENKLLTIAETAEDIEDIFKDFNIKYKKEGEIYFYEVAASKSAEIGESKKYGMSQEKNGFIISVFSSGAEDKESVNILSSVAESLKDGCLGK